MNAIQQVNKLKHLSFGFVYLGSQFKMSGQCDSNENVNKQ